jgi:phosphoribosylglycinamide formyltransferase-1
MFNRRSKNVLILASGSGSNAQALVEYAQKKGLDINFVGGCNKPRGKAGVYERLEKLGVETYYLPSPGPKGNRNFKYLTSFLKYNPVTKGKIDLILMAGYMLILPKHIVRKYNVLNIHPSVLPYKYQGSEHAYDDALNNGDVRTGCTVHRAIPKVDAGPIIAQIGFSIPPSVIENKDIETLKAIGLAHEHILYPAVMQAVLYHNIGGIKLNMAEVAIEVRDLFAERNLEKVMRDYGPIIPANNKMKFDSWNAAGR